LNEEVDFSENVDLKLFYMSSRLLTYQESHSSIPQIFMFIVQNQYQLHWYVNQ